MGCTANKGSGFRCSGLSSIFRNRFELTACQLLYAAWKPDQERSLEPVNRRCWRVDETVGMKNGLSIREAQPEAERFARPHGSPASF